MTEEEIIAAVRNGAVDLPSPASPEAVSDAEKVIGYPLPPLLRRLYLEVANGGFGPDIGVLGVAGGEWIGDWENILDVHRAFATSDPGPLTPEGFVWLVDWGCNIWTLIDCRDSYGWVWGWDPSGSCCLDHALFPQHLTLADWLARWLDGTLTMPSASESPKNIIHRKQFGEASSSR
ncbi:SMI1/KNR4 family protein [Micromonospora musae]|uniref:SMI1/KNR4 family protein n=1 Tax=Micromonospora musae TaxID=1894970 RepID=UPI0033D37904